MLINILNLPGSVIVLQFNQIFIWQHWDTFILCNPSSYRQYNHKNGWRWNEDCWLCFLFSIMLRIIISGGEKLYSVMCEDYCVIFNTWEGGYYGFIKWIFHVVFSIYKILGNKEKLVNNITKENHDCFYERSKTFFIVEL